LVIPGVKQKSLCSDYYLLLIDINLQHISQISDHCLLIKGRKQQTARSV